MTIKKRLVGGNPSDFRSAQVLFLFILCIFTDKKKKRFLKAENKKKFFSKSKQTWHDEPPSWHDLKSKTKAVATGNFVAC